MAIVLLLLKIGLVILLVIFVVLPTQKEIEQGNKKQE